MLTKTFYIPDIRPFIDHRSANRGLFSELVFDLEFCLKPRMLLFPFQKTHREYLILRFIAFYLILLFIAVFFCFYCKVNGHE